MRGKTVMFVGDSLGRNQWESLVCLIYSAAPQTQTQMVKGDPLSTFSFLVSLWFVPPKTYLTRNFFASFWVLVFWFLEAIGFNANAQIQTSIWFCSKFSVSKTEQEPPQLWKLMVIISVGTYMMWGFTIVHTNSFCVWVLNFIKHCSGRRN